MANLKIMKLITYLNRKKAWAFLLLLFPAVATYAQWDYDYPISMQVQQKTLSNSLIQSSYNNNYIGVVNEANNTGFWIYEMGASGQVISSHFYSTTITSTHFPRRVMTQVSSFSRRNAARVHCGL